MAKFWSGSFVILPLVSVSWKNAWAFVCKAGLIMMDLLAVKQQFGGAAVDTYHYHFLKGINHRVKRLRMKNDLYQAFLF